MSEGVRRAVSSAMTHLSPALDAANGVCSHPAATSSPFTVSACGARSAVAERESDIGAWSRRKPAAWGPAGMRSESATRTAADAPLSRT